MVKRDAQLEDFVVLLANSDWLPLMQPTKRHVRFLIVVLKCKDSHTVVKTDVLKGVEQIRIINTA